MPIEIKPGRQFIGGTTSAALFDEQGDTGTWLPAAAAKLIGQNIRVTLQGPTGPNELVTQADWDAFIQENASNKNIVSTFAERFRITFKDFLEVIDDAARSTDTNLTLNLSPTSTLAQTLSLDAVDHDYGSKLAANSQVDLGGGVTATTGQLPSIGPDILANPVNNPWERDRSEQESWADFATGNGAARIFRANTGPAPFEKLHQPKWDDPEAMALVEQFQLPLHLEISRNNPDGTPVFQDGNEMFRETYYDDANRSLTNAGASVRARVRFDDDPPFDVRRVLVQAKAGRQVDPLTGRSSVRKFEKRWEQGDEQQAHSALVTGREAGGDPLSVSQKLYQLAKDAGTLPEDGQLRLQPQHMVLQRRRRTHLRMDGLFEVKNRRDDLTTQMDALTAAGNRVPPAMEAYAKKLDAQIATLEEMGQLLQKYGQFMPAGETFIVSADRYNVYDPWARAALPNDIGDEDARVGTGLHVEAEWDAASSDVFMRAMDAIDDRLATNPANQAELLADKAKLESYREIFRQDVAKTVELLKDRLVKAGLTLDPSALSKDDRAAQMMERTGSRPTYWL
ncbi:MAG: hypothetical protein ACT4TC_16865 [Myxococcaceae bacterium]